MYTILNEKESIIIEKNSKFITYSYKVLNKIEVTKILKYLKEIHPKANHHCYAYILEKDKKSSDDKEPKNTAGLPILNVLEKHNIINALIVVIRYFGGIELGTGGLTRAYSLSATTSINESKKIKIEKAYLIKIIIPYEKQNNLDYILKSISNIKKEYTEKISYIFSYPISNINDLNNYDYEILNETYIEKKEVPL